MDWIDQNLDAYRVIAEILTDLRPLVRDRIESKYGKEWFRDGIPERVFDRLVRNKEQEASIDWYENRYQEVIGYAVFPDLFEIIIANPTLFGPILKLTPNQSLLSTRFLELEVMRSKIGRAREVGETEINFLTSFHIRFRRAVQELRGSTDEAAAPYEVTEPVPDSEAEPTEPAQIATDQPASSDATPSIATDGEETTVADGQAKTARPPQRLASPSAKTAEAREEKESVEIEVDAFDESPKEAETEAKDEEPKVKEATSTILERAMKENDDQTVLREVYREVTGIAEVIWTTEEIPTTTSWDRVSSNQWYEASFSRLELRPLSDFYDLISQVRAKRKSGLSKSDIQRFLNDSNFATTLLALRDMFQKNQI